jgi:putative acetyltransferase
MAEKLSSALDASMKLRQAISANDVQEVRELFAEYHSGLGINLCFQQFDKEVSELPGEYVPPEGSLLIAGENDQVAGCIALRKLEEGTCEMKRLYVRPEFRGTGLGRTLAQTIIDVAREAGYKRMRLDTLPGKMDQAIAMYRKLGFRNIPSYYNNPVEGAVFMELVLDKEDPASD